MIPIALDPRFARRAVAGNGPLALRRFRALRAAGAADALLFSDAPDDEAVVGAGAAWRRAMPGPDDLAALHVLWIGDLLLTISTDCRAPGLAGVIRRNLELRYGPEWAERVAEIGALREGWRREGVTMPEAAKRIATLASERNWLCDRVCDVTTPQSQG
ncbi:siroheme synthase [Acidiphilium acidophilum]|uniref:siroheme synthase n=1 Tax=Acidiphilium acidophilum TaxID=76588 RepID=UPI002E8E7875|nr:siroheme synthase [Acidiphilium acidophilum]